MLYCQKKYREEVMLDQTIANLLTTALGGMLAITGGLVATVSTQALNNKAERRKFLREKCEEVYLLSEQVKLWVKNEHDKWWQDYTDQFEPDNPIPEGYRKEYKQLDCPIDKLLMIVQLHLPMLQAKAEALKASVNTYQDFARDFLEEGWDAFPDDIETVLRSIRKKFGKSYWELKQLIEITVLESWGTHLYRAGCWKRNTLLIRRISQRIRPREIK